MGLIGYQPTIQPPNAVPEWTSTPAPVWVAGVGGSIDFNDYTFDQEGDPLTYSLNDVSPALPAGVTIVGTSLVASAAVTAGTTTGIIIDCDDPESFSSIPSSQFDIVISPAGTFLWSGTVESGSFDEWHFNTSTASVQFSFMPGYGRPPNYGGGSGGSGAGSATQTQSGDGSLCDIVSATSASPYPTGPARVGDKSIMFTVKNSVNGTETVDCDLNGTDCSNRRSELQDTHWTIDTDEAVAVCPHGTERWLSLSIYLESDFPDDMADSTISGFTTLFGIKGGATVGAGAYAGPIQGWLGITLGSGGWVFRDTWMADGQASNANYWYQFRYGPDGANYTAFNTHYPNYSASTAMMSNLNKGGWNDFIFHWLDDTTDYADQEASNPGYLDIYMRQNAGAWLHLLAIRPANNVTYGGTPARYYNKGIGLTGGYYTNMAIGMYCRREKVWNAANNATLYFDNVKVGDENATFEQMTPDGSSL